MDTNQKPVAVVCDNVPETLMWLRQLYGEEIEKVNQMNRCVDLKDGRRLVIITYIEQALGYEFSAVMIAPNYHSLLDQVLRRVR